MELIHEISDSKRVGALLYSLNLVCILEHEASPLLELLKHFHHCAQTKGTTGFFVKKSICLGLSSGPS